MLEALSLSALLNFANFRRSRRVFPAWTDQPAAVCDRYPTPTTDSAALRILCEYHAESVLVYLDSIDKVQFMRVCRGWRTAAVAARMHPITALELAGGDEAIADTAAEYLRKRYFPWPAFAPFRERGAHVASVKASFRLWRQRACAVCAQGKSLSNMGEPHHADSIVCRHCRDDLHNSTHILHDSVHTHTIGEFVALAIAELEPRSASAVVWEVGRVRASRDVDKIAFSVPSLSHVDLLYSIYLLGHRRTEDAEVAALTMGRIVNSIWMKGMFRHRFPVSSKSVGRPSRFQRLKAYHALVASMLDGAGVCRDIRDAIISALQRTRFDESTGRAPMLCA